MWTKIKEFLLYRWGFMLGVLGVWVVPIYLLGERVSFVKEVSAGYKITFICILVLAFLFLAIRKRLWAYAWGTEKGIIRGLLLLFHRIVSYGLLFGVLWGISTFSSTMFTWWQISGIPMAIGSIFYIVDELMCKKFLNKSKE